MSASRRVWWSLVAALLPMGCGDPTEIVVFADTSLGVPCQVDTVEIVVRAGGEEIRRTGDPAAGVQSLTIIQDGGVDRFNVEVNGLKDGLAVARGLADASFEEESRQSLSVTLTEACTVSSPCDFGGSLGAFGIPSPAPRGSCEGISRNYEVSTASFITPVNACSVAIPLREVVFGPSGQETLNAVALTASMNEGLATALRESFDFRFYGERIQQVWVSDDGYVSFGPSAPTVFVADDRPPPIPPGVGVLPDVGDSRAPDFSVLAFFEDFQVREPAEVCMALDGAGDNQTLWITWNNVCFGTSCPSRDSFVFSVGLDESTNEIIVGYDLMTSPGTPE